ncbi:hypothetical protein [Pseudidiomarina donghaiensis]|uniref:Uncharacterized protein n=1 Tax=Pseudidiomarina donghaiensis TaxID=519452 RepID=A0A432XMD7_9GAMM|nr:hypothetical protein [Pseudidiomarina donghaiensis]RUO49870.1 hypothetical protein CWE24_05200 [Pseudidiomarina donghaiensis]SFV22037.1 hypothetical protein SAMN04488139_1181 [Pseudidiomarina donghaiensis]
MTNVIKLPVGNLIGSLTNSRILRFITPNEQAKKQEKSIPDRRLADFCTQLVIPYKMVKYTHMKLKVFICAALSVIVLIGCNPNSPSTTLVTKHSSNEKIFHKIDPDQPQVEQQISVLIQAPDDIQFTLGKVEGINMNMGYMPVNLVRESANEWRANLYLGACTEPRMQWRVSLPWFSSTAEQNGVYQFDFYTETN